MRPAGLCLAGAGLAPPTHDITRRNRVLFATRIAAVLLVGALAIEAVGGGEIPLVHVEAALLR